MVLQHLSCVSNTVEKSLTAQHGLTKKKKRHVIWNQGNSQLGNLTKRKLFQNRWWNQFFIFCRFHDSWNAKVWSGRLKGFETPLSRKCNMKKYLSCTSSIKEDYKVSMLSMYYGSVCGRYPCDVYANYLSGGHFLAWDLQILCKRTPQKAFKWRSHNSFFHMSVPHILAQIFLLQLTSESKHWRLKFPIKDSATLCSCEPETSKNMCLVS